MKSLLNWLWLVLFLPLSLNLNAQNTPSIETRIDSAKEQFDASQYPTAIEAFTQLLEADEVVGNDSLQLSLKHYIANSHFRMGNFQGAIQFANAALVHREAVPQHAYTTKNFKIIGACNLMLGNTSEGVKYMLSALEAAEVIKDSSAIADAHLNLGHTYQQTRQLEEALFHLNRGLEVHALIGDPDLMPVAKGNMGLGLTYQWMNQLQSAVFHMEKCLSILEQTENVPYSQVLGTYLSLSGLHSNLGHANYSEQLLLKALDIYENKLPTKRPDYLADIYINLSHVYTEKSEFEGALHYGKEALALHLKTFGPQHPRTGSSYQSLGIIYARLREQEQALYHLNQGLEIFRNGYGPGAAQTADVLMEIGSALFWQKKYEDALPFFEEALHIDTAFNEASNYRGKKFFWLAINLEELKQYEAAERLLRQSLAYETQSGSDYKLPLALNYCALARVYRALEQVDKAKVELVHAAKTLRYDPTNPYDFSTVQHMDVLSLYFQAQGQVYDLQARTNPVFLDSGLNNHLYNLASIEARRARLSKSSARKFYSNRMYIDYEMAIGAHLESERPEQLAQAFSIMERTKKMRLGEEFFHASRNLYSDSLLKVDQQLKEAISYYQRKLFELDELQSTGNREVYVDTLEALKIKQTELITSIQTDIPNYYALNYTPTLFNLEQCQSLLQPNETLLEFFVGDTILYVFAVNANDFKHHKISLDYELEAQIEQLRSGIYDYHTGLTKNEKLAATSKTNYQQAATTLYADLIQPLESYLKAEVIIIPDGALHYIPFEALLTKAAPAETSYANLPYWINQKSIRYAFSGQQLNLAAAKTAPQKDKRLGVFAPSYMQDVDAIKQQYAALAANRFNLGPLEHNASEAQSIAQVFQADLYLDQSATREQFMQVANEYNILHLATHGKAYDVNGNLSYLAFSTDTSGNQLENLLFVEDVYGMQLDNELVVLSACETGLGELVRGTGVVSLSNGLAFAGVRSQVSTLWQISDESTSQFMPQFYANLKAGLRKHHALQDVKKRFIADEKYAAPFYWAGYTLSGDPTPIQGTDTNFQFWIILFIFFTTTLALWTLRRARQRRARR